MGFRAFASADEEKLAGEIIEGIDRGEGWIFDGAKGSADFGGFLDRLFYVHEGAYGTFCSCVFAGQLRLQIGFEPDMPLRSQEDLLSLIKDARRRVNTPASIWYKPENANLHDLICHHMPWKTRGHRTYELSFSRNQATAVAAEPRAGVSIVPFTEEYLLPVCTLFDRALAHTFDNPDHAVFVKGKDKLLSSWLAKAENGDCCVMIEDGFVAGAYVLKGAEIDLMAVALTRQGRGLGRFLLHHAKDHIFAVTDGEPHLYCIDTNLRALKFYLREGMERTGYSGCAFLD